MKLKRIFAGVAATALAVSTCASFSASATDGYDAFLMYADHDWLWQSMSAQNGIGTGVADRSPYGVDAYITKDGEYTVSITKDSVTKNSEGDNPQGPMTPSATGAAVFCIDITGILKCKKFDAKAELKNGVKENGTYSEDDIKCKLKSIKLDGKDFAFDASKVLYGNIEDQNTCYRIEVYNDYGETKDDPPIDKAKIEWSESISATFEISGLSSGEEKTTKAASGSNDTQATTAAVGGGADTNTTSNTNTGAETGLALIGLALAGGAIVLTKKRK